MNQSGDESSKKPKDTGDNEVSLNAESEGIKQSIDSDNTGSESGVEKELTSRGITDEEANQTVDATPATEASEQRQNVFFANTFVTGKTGSNNNGKA